MPKTVTTAADASSFWTVGDFISLEMSIVDVAVGVDVVVGAGTAAGAGAGAAVGVAEDPVPHLLLSELF